MNGRGQTGPAELVPLSGLAYGVHVRGELPASCRPYLREAGTGSAGRLGLEVVYRTIAELPPVEEIWVAEPQPAGAERFALFREAGAIGLTVSGEGSGLFRIARGKIDVGWLPGGSGVGHYLFAYALPLWLEQAGVPVLHASAVLFGDRAVAFVGRTGIGKSTLCAELVRGGCGFLADDGLPFYEGREGDWVCAPGPPLFRLWPSALEGRLGVAAAALPRVHDSRDKRLLPSSRGVGTGEPGVSRLSLVYLLDRQPGSDAAVSSSGLSDREALISLLEHSLAAGPAAAFGWAPRRLEQLARFVARTPIRRLGYPTGADSREQVRRIIERDLAAADGGSPR